MHFLTLHVMCVYPMKLERDVLKEQRFQDHHSVNIPRIEKE